MIGRQRRRDHSSTVQEATEQWLAGWTPAAAGLRSARSASARERAPGAFQPRAYCSHYSRPA